MTPHDGGLEAAEQMPAVGSLMRRSPLSVAIDATIRVAEYLRAHFGTPKEG